MTRRKAIKVSDRQALEPEKVGQIQAHAAKEARLIRRMIDNGATADFLARQMKRPVEWAERQLASKREGG